MRWLFLLGLLPSLSFALPVTLAWDRNPSHDAPGIVWRLEVSGALRTCTAMVTPSDRRCTVDLVRGPTTIRLRAELGEDVSAWSNTVSADVNEPGQLLIVSHQETAAPPPLPPISHHSSGVGPGSVAVPAGTLVAVAAAGSAVPAISVTNAQQLATLTYAFRRRLSLYRAGGPVQISASGAQEVLWVADIVPPTQAPVTASNDVTSTLTLAIPGAAYCVLASEAGSGVALQGTQLGLRQGGSNVRTLRTGRAAQDCRGAWPAGNGAAMIGARVQ